MPISPTSPTQKYKDVESSLRIKEVDGLELVRKFSEDMETMLRRKVEAVKVLQSYDLWGFHPSAHDTKMTLSVVALHPLSHTILFLPYECLLCIPMSLKILVTEKMMASKGSEKGPEI